jgi:MFS family permease
MAGARPLASYRALELGAGAVGIGVLVACFAAGTLLFALPIGRAIDRWGGAPILLVSAILAPACLLGIGAATEEWMLWSVCAVYGVVHLAGLVSMQSLAAVDGQSMDRSFGNLSAAMSIGQLIGPALALALPSVWVISGLSTTTTGALVLVAVSVVGMATAIAQLARTGHERRPDDVRKPASARALIVVPGFRIALLSSGIVLASIDLLTAYLPLWATTHGIGAELVASLLMLRAVVTIGSRFGLARVVKRLGRRAVLVGSVGVGTIGLAVLPFVDLVGAAIVMGALGLGLGIAQPLTLAWVSTIVPIRDRAAAFALRMTANRLFQTLVPLTVGTASPALAALGLPGAASTHAFLAAAALMGASGTAIAFSRNIDS